MKNTLSNYEHEEQMVFNSIAIGVSKAEFLEKLKFYRAVSNDDDIFELYDRVQAKTIGLSEEGWAELQLHLPFDLPFSNSEPPDEDMQMQ